MCVCVYCSRKAATTTKKTRNRKKNIKTDVWMLNVCDVMHAYVWVARVRVSLSRTKPNGTQQFDYQFVFCSLTKICSQFTLIRPVRQRKLSSALTLSNGTVLAGAENLFLFFWNVIQINLLLLLHAVSHVCIFCHDAAIAMSIQFRFLPLLPSANMFMDVHSVHAAFPSSLSVCRTLVMIALSREWTRDMTPDTYAHTHTGRTD